MKSQQRRSVTDKARSATGSRPLKHKDRVPAPTTPEVASRFFNAQAPHDRSPRDRASDLLSLQRAAGNRATRKAVADQITPVRPRIQAFHDWSELYKSGWKYSGGTMATFGGVGPLWHASVYRVDKDGNSAATGLFCDGFHLTMEGVKNMPHVFFDADGNYQEGKTLGHKQTKVYLAVVGQRVLDQDIAAAKAMAPTVLGTLGVKIDAARRDEMQAAEAAKKQDEIDAEAAALAAAIQAKAELDAAQAAGVEDRTASVKLVLADAGVTGFVTTYIEQFEAYLDGDKEAIKAKFLMPVVNWYVAGKAAHWPVSDKPQSLYKGFDKAPNVIAWTDYANSIERRWRGMSKLKIPYEYRALRFNGYASYRVHPSAKKPPKV